MVKVEERRSDDETHHCQAVPDADVEVVNAMIEPLVDEHERKDVHVQAAD